MTNSIKYNKHFGNITITDALGINQYILTITDTGIGMEVNQISKIFNRYTRVNFDQEGQGIGLAIVDSIAKLHQIEIQVTSVISQGTSFKIIFPIT